MAFNLGAALGAQSAEEYAGAVKTHSDLQKLQRDEQSRINRLEYGANKTPGQTEANIQLAPPSLDLDQFKTDQRFVEPSAAPELSQTMPGSPELITQEPPAAKPPEQVGPNVITDPADGSTVVKPADTATGQENAATGQNLQPSHLTIPDYDPKITDNRAGTLGTPDITQIDPESSAFMQSVQGLFARGDLSAAMQKIQTRIATGYGDMLAASPMGRVYGYFSDNPSEAKLRADSKKALDWFKTDEAAKYFQQNPNAIGMASIDPIGFHQTYIKEAPMRQDRQVRRESADRTDALVERVTNPDYMTDGLSQPDTAKVIGLARQLGVDPYLAASILAIESDFGRNPATNTVTLRSGAKVTITGSMQVSNKTFDYMKEWFTNADNISKYNISPEVQAAARGLQANSADSQMAAGVLYLKYGQLIGVPKELIAAGYQGGMEGVLKRNAPSNANDGNITNYDYNRAFVNIYNSMLTQFPAVAGGAQTNTQTTAGASVQTQPPVVQTQPVTGGQVADAGVDTTAQSTNTGNAGTASTDISGMQVVTPSTGGGTATQPPVTTTPTTPSVVQPQEPAFYAGNPAAIGFEMQQGLAAREQYARDATNRINTLNGRLSEYERMAQVSRISGDLDNYERYTELAQKLRDGITELRSGAESNLRQTDGKIMYLQGMQALQELNMGNTQRASAVWSAFTGRKIQIVPRSDGKYDIEVDGKLWKTEDYGRLSQRLQLTFDSEFRKTQQASASKRAEMTFEAALEMSKERNKAALDMYTKATVERIKQAGENYRKQLEQQGAKFTTTTSGVLVYMNGNTFFFDPLGEEYKDVNGETKIRHRLIPVTSPNMGAGTTSSAESFLSAYQ